MSWRRTSWVSGLVLLLSVWAAPAFVPAVETSKISEETVRSARAGTRVVNFWWLPAEYWVAAAQEIGKSSAEVDQIRQLFRSYNLLAALDVKLRPDGSFDALSTAEIVRRAEISINGKPADVMQQVDQRVQQLVPELTYVLQASLGPLGTGLHLLPLANLGSDGRPILTGTGRGTVQVRYQAEPTGGPAEFWWHAPLTAVMGEKRCANGAPAEASWAFCPWDGKPLEEN